jgi:magnesium transporter
MTAKVRVMDVTAEGPSSTSEGDSSVAPPPGGTLRWVDVQGQGEAQIKLLEERFGFHPLTLEDCLHFDQRPKLEEYGDYIFVVIHAFSCPAGNPCEVEPQEVHAFLGAGYLVTVHEADVGPLESVWKRVELEPTLLRKGLDFVFYLLADALVDSNFPILDLAADRLEEIENSVLERSSREDLNRIFELKRTLVLMRKVLSPERDVFAMLSKRADRHISEKTALYLRDVYDHLVRIYESIDTGRDLLGNALEAYLSMVSNRTNEIMKRLTLLSAVFLPLTFITGFFGQNFEHLPFHSDALMYAMITACFVIPTVMVVLFKRSGWF